MASLIVFSLRMMKVTAIFGDNLMWVFRILNPSYNICSAIIYEICRSEMRDRRDLIIREFNKEGAPAELKPKVYRGAPWNIDNFKGDTYGLLIQIVVYWLIFFIIEGFDVDRESFLRLFRKIKTRIFGQKNQNISS